MAFYSVEYDLSEWVTMNGKKILKFTVRDKVFRFFFA